MMRASTESVEAVAAWADFLELLRESGDILQSPEGATDELEAAEGYRYLTRVLAAGFDMFIENGDRLRPHFTRLMTPTRKFFGDNPDTDYDYAPLDGRRAYRILCTRGTVHYVAFCVYGGTRGGAGQNRIVANVSDRELDFDDDGTTEIVLAPERPANTRNWIQLEPDVTSVVVRQYYLDRSREVPATYRIEPIGDAGPPEPLSDAFMARRLRAVGTFVRNATAASARIATRLAAAPNTFSLHSDADEVVAFYPTPDNRYTAAWYRLAPDEALVVTGRPPPSRYWSLILQNRWMESYDHRHHRIVINNNDVVLEPDGSFRFVVAHHDPGVPNWLNTAGHSEGYVMFRWMQSEGVRSPATEVVAFDEVRS